MPSTAEEADARTEEASAFVFADLAGYTAVTEAHGDEQAADLAAHFFAHARELLARCDGEEVKVIGDEMMARIEDPAAAIRFALDLGHHSMRRHEHLAVQVGLHYGPALRRGGDWFGATVNIAARVTSLAQPGEVLTTAETARAAGDIEGVSYRSRGETRLRHIREPMTLLSVLSESEAADLERDPVCHMLLDPSRATEQLSHGGVDYWFCSSECRATFESDPGAYTYADRPDPDLDADASGTRPQAT
jgi:adenylate cyclase